MLRAPVFAVIVAFSLSGIANAADTPAPPDAGQTTTQPMVLPDPKDPHIAKAMEFIDVSGAKELALQRVDIMLPLIMKTARSSDSKADDKYWAVFETEARDLLHRDINKLLLVEASIYVRHFTDSDLDQLVAFYKTDVGKKYLAERKAIVSESAGAGMAWARAVIPELVEQVKKKLQSNTEKQTL